jgi:plastocyanin
MVTPPAALALVMVVVLAAATPVQAAPDLPPDWPGDNLPLPLQVKSAADLAFKNEVERQFLMFNLMTVGKRAFEIGDYPRAVRKWEALLKLPAVPLEIQRAVRPLLEDAQQAAATGAPPVPRPPLPAGTLAAPGGPTPVVTLERSVPERVSVSGTVIGGGAIGPGGTVLWLKRLDGPTPAVRPLRRPKVVGQKDKTFIPRVVAIPVGSKIDFRNDDPYYHNVFSLTDTQPFDTGLYASGLSYGQSFDRPGAVEILCNIHAAMVGYVVVVDTPYYTQPRSNGSFLLRNVPPGRYELSAWHEASANVIKQRIHLQAAGAQGVTVKIPSDRKPLIAVPDKYGKPRQPQLGY